MSRLETSLGMDESVETIHRPGWLCNRLVQGDCLRELRRVPDNSIQLVLCDLPYGTTANDWDSVISLPILWTHYRRILKPGGVVALTGQGPFTARLILSNESWFKYKMVWVKSKATNFLNAKRQPLRKHEDVVIFYGSRPVYNVLKQPGDPYDKGIRKNQLTGSYGEFNPSHCRSDGGRYPTDVVYFKSSESEGTVYHPTQKPVQLGRYLVRMFSNPGDVVLDNSFGSGSFLVSALLEGRNFYGIELNDESFQFCSKRTSWFDIARKRLKEAWKSLDSVHRGWITRVGELRGPVAPVKAPTASPAPEPSP